MVDVNHDRNVLMETLSTADQHAVVRAYIATRDLFSTLTFDEFLAISHKHFPSFHGFATQQVESLSVDKQHRVLLAYIEAVGLDPSLTFRAFITDVIVVAQEAVNPKKPDLAAISAQPLVTDDPDIKQFTIKLAAERVAVLISTMQREADENASAGNVLEDVALVAVDVNLFFGIQIVSSAYGPYLDVCLVDAASVVCVEHKPVRTTEFFAGQTPLSLEYGGTNYKVDLEAE
jgi:hypothetical protein